MMSLKDVVNTMDAVGRDGRPIPFSITVVKRSTGEIKKYSNATKLVSDKPLKPSVAKAAQAAEKVRKNPNHSFNQTRNIQLENKQIRKIHLRLITEFNSNTVYW